MRRKRLRISDKFIRYIVILMRSNPVLSWGLGLAFVVVAATSVSNALALTLALGATAVPVAVLASITKDMSPRWVKLPAYTMLAMAMLSLVRAPLQAFAPTIMNQLGIYYPLMAINPVILTRISSFDESTTTLRALSGVVFDALGFGVAAVLVGGIRELMVSGTLAGFPAGSSLSIPGAAIPFFGFIIAGFLAAALRGIKRGVILLALYAKAPRSVSSRRRD